MLDKPAHELGNLASPFKIVRQVRSLTGDPRQNLVDLEQIAGRTRNAGYSTGDLGLDLAWMTVPQVANESNIGSSGHDAEDPDGRLEASKLVHIPINPVHKSVFVDWQPHPFLECGPVRLGGLNSFSQEPAQLLNLQLLPVLLP